MKRPIPLPLLCAAALAGSSSAPRAAVPSADLILHGGAIYTVDQTNPWAAAVAVRSGEIVYVGPDSALAAFTGANTTLIDLEGRMAMPGIHDSHVHILESNHVAAGTCYLPPGRPLESYIPKLQACAPYQIGTNWVLGYGHSIIDVALHLQQDGRPPRDILDEAIPDRPAVMLELTSHSVWANSLALQAAGFGPDTPDPPGGAILHDPATGEPNGILLDGAGEIVMDLALTPNWMLRELNYDALLVGLALARKNGITSLADARAYWRRGYLGAWRQAAARGTLTARAVVGLWAYPYLDDDQQIATLASLYTGDAESRLRFSQIKVYADGELSHTTAALIEPYLRVQLAGERGLEYFDQARLERYITALEPVGFDFHIHAIGDRGVHQALNAIAATRPVGEGATTARHRLTHVFMVAPADIGRFSQLSVIADMQIDALSHPENQRYYWPILGRRRVEERMYRLRSLHDAGARVVLSSDYDVGDISPFHGMHHALSIGTESLPDLAAAIRAYTIDPAYLMRQEQRVGSIEVGKLADIIVLDQNLFEIPPAQIGRTKVLLTLLEGEEIWRAPGFGR